MLVNLESRIQKQDVFRFWGYKENASGYTVMSEEFDLLQPVLYENVLPKAVMGISKADQYLLDDSVTPDKGICGQENILFLLVTLGSRIQQTIKAYYEEGNYPAHFLLNAMADAYLFEMERNWKLQVKSYCRERGFGIKRRVEMNPACHKELLKQAMEELEADRHLGVKTTDAFLFSPIKTMLYGFVLSDQIKTYEIDHDCTCCSNYTCRMRNAYENKNT